MTDRYLWYVGHEHYLNAPCGGCPNGHAASLETARDMARFAIQRDHAAIPSVKHDVGYVRFATRVVATVR